MSQAGSLWYTSKGNVVAFEIVVVGTSIGGLKAIQTLLSALPDDFPVPMVIVQHHGKDSEIGLCDFLTRSSRLPISEPEDKEQIVSGRVYLAPRDYHLLVEKGSFALSTDPAVGFARPSIDVLFESVADEYQERAIGVVLTGANRDGGRGLAAIKLRGGLTLVEDPASAACREMPDAAIAGTAVDYIQHDPGRVLESFCRSAKQIVDAQESGVGVINGDGQTLRYFFRCGGNEDGASANGVPKIARRALQHLVSERRPLRLNDTDDLLRVKGKTSELVHSFLGAPILSGSKVAGWLYLINKVNAEDFTEADERLAATLATQVAVAYENAMLYSDAQRHASELQLEIAERKQAEEERAQLLVREQAARAEAEQANRTKDEFLATLSHELRTPLSAILGWSHLVRSGKLDESQMSRAFETIERNARSQSQLIDDLLDVSRIITGKLQIEPRPVDLCGVIEAASDAVRPALEAKAIKFEAVMNSENCFVLGDPTRLQQIFWNLFSNAVKFTPEGGHVRVEIKHVDSAIRVSVSDTGVGITPEFLPYIFDRFRQADGSTTRIHGGLGLGLSIVKHLVQLHQGSVVVESPGKDHGSTFTVALPQASAASALAPEEIAEAEPESDALPAALSRVLEGLRILVVDDEVDSRDLVSAILTRCGSEVNCCDSATDALKVILDWKPDLLVSDIGMPNEDGYSLIKKMRKLKSKRARQTPAVALTAYVTYEDRERALAAGFQMHVPKPIEPTALVMSIVAASGRKV